MLSLPLKVSFSEFSRKKMAVIVTLISILQIVILICVFFACKKGYYGDEVYSYGTADSSETMSPLKDFDGTIHTNEWMKTKKMTQSVMLSKDELFNYGHIKEILRDDDHPPFYFYLLHFFSSFFLDTFSWIPAVIINAIAILLLQIYFYRLLLLISQSRVRSLLSMIFFGCTSAAVNMMTYARNYTLVTALTLVYTYYAFKTMDQYRDGKRTAGCMGLMAISFFFSAYTQYISIIYAFVLTLVICIYYLIEKKICFMLKFGSSMMMSFLLLVLIYRDFLHHIFSSHTSTDFSSTFPLALEIRLSIHIPFNEIFGINTPVLPSMLFFWMFWMMVGFLVVFILVSFVFRNDDWFKKLIRRLKDIVKKCIKDMRQERAFQYFALLITVISLIIAVGCIFKIYFYFPFSDRYLFIIYPAFCITIMIPVFMMLRKISLCIVTLICLTVLSLFAGEKPYLYSGNTSVSKVNSYIEGADVIVYGQKIISATGCLLHFKDSDRVFFTTADDYEKGIKNLKEGIIEEKPLFLIYGWPTFSFGEEGEEFKDILSDFRESGITNVDVTDSEYDAELVTSFNGFVVCRLR